MTPILYEKDEIDFTSHGLGSLVEIYDVDVEEQRNGLLQLTASYPVSGLRYADISVGRIILAKPNQRDDIHAFRIVSTELDISGYAVTIEADSITYDLTHNLVKHLVASGNGQSFMTALKNVVVNPSIFAFYSDIATSSTTSLDYVNPMEAIMGTTGSFLQIWGGELKRENRRVAMFNRRGRDNVATFRLGKNISGLKYSVDISSLVTRIIPTKSVQNDDQTTTTLEGTPVDSKYINNYEQIYTLPLEFTDDTIKTVADLNAASKGWFTKSANTGRDKPTVTIDIDVLSLQDSADYQDKFKNLESVSLTDTVTVYVPEYGVNVTAIVNELHYDPILDRVTKMTVGTAKQSFADSSRTQLSDLQDKIISVQSQADAVAVSANGKSTNYYGSVEPSHPQEGDTWFWVNGDKSGIKQFVNGDWADLVDSDTQEKIAASVTEAVTQAKEHVDEVKQGLSSDIATAKSQATSLANAAVTQANAHTATAIEQNNASQQEVMNDIAKSQADLAIKDGDFNNKAQAMADKALADAKSNTTQVAQEALNSANQNIADAKKSVTDDIAREASDRASAVAAANSQAQSALSAAKTDLTKSIANEASARNAAVAAANSQAQTYANQAKADALNTIAKEVTDRQNAVSALDTKATNAVNQAKSDINDTINSLSVGGRNYLLNSNGSTLDKWTPVNGWSIVSDADRGNVFTFTPTASWTGGSTNSLSQARTDFPTNKTVTVSFWAKASVDGAKFHSEPTGGTAADNTVLNVSLKTNWQRYSYTFYLSSARIYFMPVDSGVTYWVDDLQLEIGNMISDYNQSPEDIVYDYTDKDNQIKQTFTQYQQSNDGKVSRAQTDATTALGQVATKVSQTDYDQKTGDLTTKYTQVKQTTDSQATDIVDIKKTATSQASKINSISSDVDGTKQSISDIETTQDSQSDKINQITSDVNGTKQSITDIQTKDGKQDTRMGTIETSVSGVKSDFSTYKTDANGRISAAQTTVQTAVDGLKTKVSQTDYNTKTGQLQTDLTTTTQTANQAKTDIVSIKQTDTSQDSRMNTIESDASGTKQTVSDIQTKQGQQSGSISTLKQRADGFDATVTKVDNLSVGARNYFLNSSGTSMDKWSQNGGWTNVGSAARGTVFTINSKTPWSGGATNSLYQSGINIDSGTQVTVSFWAKADVDGANFHSEQTGGSGSFDTKLTTTFTKYSYTFVLTSKTVYFMAVDSGVSYYVDDVKLETGNIATDWTPAPEDVDSATAKAQLTADNAGLAISKLTSADGVITKAQADIRANADAITAKVSKTVYDQKTGDLNQAISKAQSTADGVVTTVGNYKTSNDERVESAESKIEQNSKDITARVIQTDYDDFKGSYKSTMSEINSTFERITSTVSETETTVNKLNQVNLVNNSQFTPDYSGWHVGTPWGNSLVSEIWNNGIEKNTGAMWVWHDWSKSSSRIYSDPISIYGGSPISASVFVAMPNQSASGIPIALYIITYDSSKNVVDRWNLNVNYNMIDGTFRKFSLDNKTPSSNALYATVAFDWSVGGQVSFGKPMLVFGSTTGDYVAGPYNNNDKIASQQITIDGITSIVSDPNTGLSTRVQTAEGTLNTVKSTADGAMSKASQTANDIAQEISDRKTGDNNTLQSAKDFTQSSITSSETGMKSVISQTASGILAQVDTMNMVTNSEFDPTNVGWYSMSNAIGSGLGSTWNAPTTGGFADWPIVGGSRLILYNVGTWYTSELRTSSAGKVYSASIIAGRSAVPAQSTALDFRIGFWDSGKKLLGTVSAGNIIDGASYKGMAKYSIENKTAPTGTAYVSVIIAHSGAASDIIGRPMFSSGATAVPYTPTTATTSSSTIISLFKDNWSIGINDNIGNITSGIVGNSSSMSLISKNITLDGNTTFTALKKTVGDTDSAVSKVKNTADSISNFVRDSSGNISANFQTALSKTSIITGSTLATSIKKETATQISSALADNNGKIISLINQDSSGVQIGGENIILDGTVSVLSTFWAKQINAMKVNANNITVGTLNGNQVNITNINANNIVSGAISGANLNINLNTGSVVFQKGRINSSDYTTDINIDQGYISTANGDTRAILSQGKLQLIDPTWFNPQTNPYLEISNKSGFFNGMSALIKARDSLTVSINGYDERAYDTPLSTEKFVGLSIGKYSNKLMATKIGGAEQGVIISGGKQFTIEGYGDTPYIYVGSDSSGSSQNGDRVSIHASYFHSPSTYLRTTSGSANVVVTSDGALVRSSSARKYKLDIKNNIPIADSLKLIDVPLSTWVDKHEHEENGSTERYFGMIAEDLRDAGLEYLVQYGENNEVEGINYDRVALLLIPLVKELKERIEELESKGK